MRRPILAIPLLVSPLAPALQGQTPSPASDSTLRAALERLQPGTRVRVRTVGGSTLDGRLTAVDESRLTLADARGAEAFADLSRVAALYLPHHRARRGAIIGLAVAAIPSGLLVGGLASGLCECSETGEAFREGFLVGAALGGSMGTITGLVLGSFATGWDLYWTRESGVVNALLARRHVPSGQARWLSSLHAGGGTRWGGTSRPVLAASGRLERDRGGGTRVGLEAGYMQLSRRDVHRTFVVDAGDGARDTIREHRWDASRTLHASLVLLSAIDAIGEAYWIADVGVARHFVNRRIESGSHPFPFTDDERETWPLFGIGIGTRYGKWNADLRLRWPMSFAGPAATMLSFTAGYRPGG
jgi:hypothetical protein